MKKKLIYYFIVLVLLGFSGRSFAAGYEDGLNTGIGWDNGAYTTSGILNTFIGNGAGNANNGNENTIVGFDAAHINTGYRNTMIGFEAGNKNAIGSGNVFIGKQAGYNELGSNVLYIDNSSTTNPLIFGDFTDGYEIVYIYGDLDVTGNIYTTSDKRYKKDIAPIKSSLDKIMNMRGVSFTYKAEKQKNYPDGTHFGVIAQEVEQVLPEIVDEGNDQQKRVAYMELIPVLIEAVKEQQGTITELSEKVDTLERKLMLKGSIASVNHNID